MGKGRKGEEVEFQTPVEKLHSLMFEDDGALGIRDDEGNMMGLKVLEIRPPDKENPGMLTVLAEILWIDEETL